MSGWIVASERPERAETKLKGEGGDGGGDGTLPVTLDSSVIEHVGRTHRRPESRHRQGCKSAAKHQKLKRQRGLAVSEPKPQPNDMYIALFKRN